MEIKIKEVKKICRKKGYKVHSETWWANSFGRAYFIKKYQMVIEYSPIGKAQRFSPILDINVPIELIEVLYL